MLPSLGHEASAPPKRDKAEPRSSLARLSRTQRKDDAWEQHKVKQDMLKIIQKPETAMRFKLPLLTEPLAEPDPEPEQTAEEIAEIERKVVAKRRKMHTRRLAKLRAHALEVQEKQEQKLPQLGALAKFATPGNVTELLHKLEKERQLAMQRRLETWQTDKKRRDAAARKQRQRERKQRTATYRAERARRAANVIQKAMRRFKEKLIRCRRIQLNIAREAAARVMQRSWRCYHATRQLQDLRDVRNFIAAQRVLQRVVLNWPPQKELHRRRHNSQAAYARGELYASRWSRAIQIQRVYRGYVSRRGLEMPRNLPPVGLMRTGGNKVAPSKRREERRRQRHLIAMAGLITATEGGEASLAAPTPPSQPQTGKERRVHIHLRHRAAARALHTSDQRQSGKTLWAKCTYLCSFSVSCGANQTVNSTSELLNYSPTGA